jgi:[ribosomal protein S5]-alanine N-acetyltransferase
MTTYYQLTREDRPRRSQSVLFGDPATIPLSISILRTHRLDLIPASPETLELLVAGDYGRAGERLGVVIREGWPHDPEAVAGLAWHLRALRADPAVLLWRVRLLVLRAERRVIGSVNLKGPPDATGTIEIGWGLEEPYRKQGLATEGTQAVIEWAMTQEGVQRVIATIPPDNHGSLALRDRALRRLCLDEV